MVHEKESDKGGGLWSAAFIAFMALINGTKE